MNLKREKYKLYFERKAIEQGTEGDRRSSGVPCSMAEPHGRNSLHIFLYHENLVEKGYQAPKTTSLFLCYPFHRPKKFESNLVLDTLNKWETFGQSNNERRENET